LTAPGAAGGSISFAAAAAAAWPRRPSTLLDFLADVGVGNGAGGGAGGSSMVASPACGVVVMGWGQSGGVESERNESRNRPQKANVQANQAEIPCLCLHTTRLSSPWLQDRALSLYHKRPTKLC